MDKNKEERNCKNEGKYKTFLSYFTSHYKIIDYLRQNYWQHMLKFRRYIKIKCILQIAQKNERKDWRAYCFKLHVPDVEWYNII